jgi:hypothetical protein
MTLRRLNDTEYYIEDYGDNFKSCYKFLFKKVKKFHVYPTVINKKLFWLRHSYYIERTTEKHIIIFVNDCGYPKTDIIQIRKKDYFAAKPAYEIWLIYEKMKGLIIV